MMVTTKGRYGMRVMVELARHQAEGAEGYVALKDISEEQGISMKYLEAIISRLVKAGLVKGHRGKAGGYLLTKKPEEYTVSEIIGTAQGNIAPVSCLGDGEDGCDRADVCTTLPLWKQLDRVINDYFESVTLLDVLNGDVVR